MRVQTVQPQTRPKLHSRAWVPMVRVSLFFLVTIFLQELFLKLYCFRLVPVRGLLLTLLFSAPVAMLLGLLCRVVRPKAGRLLAVILTGAICLWLGTQTVYYFLFQTFLSLSSLLRVGMVAGEFGGLAVTNILRCWFPVLMHALPFAAVFPLRRHLLPEQDVPRTGKRQWAVAAVVLHMAVTLLVLSSNDEPLSMYHIYNQSDAPELTVTNFGVLTNSRLELKRLLFGVSGEQPESPDAQGEDWKELFREEERTPSPRPEATPEDQVMDIDFDALLAAEQDEDLWLMHDHFAATRPTRKNEWTGYFEGKNLVWFVAEAFSSVAIDPQLTPALYRLSREGFVFENFYTPLWGLSTSDGEYVTTTGLVPKAGAWSYLQSAQNHMPFGFGNQFGKLGYRTLAYHNNTYTYYGREQSYPNMGYEYYGLGNGLEVSRCWPESDLEMMQLSVPQFVNEAQFAVYYLTVSGHLNYNVDQNDMAAKNWQAVEHLPYSEEPKAYLATQIELDRALESLLTQLEEAGRLEDTVIVLSGDHYPYGLQDEAISQLLGHTVDPDFELYKSTLILWNAGMEQPVPVEKYCSSLDIMPTLANLFALEYDSRLLAGRDILSDSPGLVMFSNYSFLSDRGAYVSTRESFTPWGEPQPDDEDYVTRTLDEIRDRFRFSTLILDQDYYRRLFAPETMEE